MGQDKAIGGDKNEAQQRPYIHVIIYPLVNHTFMLEFIHW